MDELKSLLTRCVKCGRCRTVCPAFQAVNRETAVARGKLALLEDAVNEGDGELDSRLSKSLSMCLLCGACTATCPNEARGHEAIRLARAKLAKKDGVPFTKRFLNSMIAKDRKKRDKLVSRASSLQGIFTSKLPDDRGLKLRLPIRRFDAEWAPKLADTFFLDRAPTEVAAKKPNGRKVGLFVGCAIHYLSPQVGDATVGLLTSLGFDVVIPQEQGCCGLMAFGSGDDDTAKKLALKTAEAFDNEEIEAVVVPCASCAAQLKKGFPEAFHDGPEDQAEKIGRFSEKVRELSDFLVKNGLPELLAEKGVADSETVTYHDPCHLKRELGISEQPRKLLKALGPDAFREMEGADRCCGMGGTFRLTHPGVSKKILGSKMESVKETGADKVATGCMGCMIQLKEGSYACDSDAKVTHLAEVLWEKLKDKIDDEDKEAEEAS